MVRIAPSLLAADFLNLEAEVRRLAEAGADILHLDVMDGVFVPNITFGWHLVAALSRLNGKLGDKRMTLDVHLMMQHPLRYIDHFCKAGADILTVHAECSDPVDECLDAIAKHGVIPGVSVKPDTDVTAVAPFIEKVGYILVMTVEPGLGGQELIPSCLEKIPQVRAMAGGRPVMIAVDGGIHRGNCRDVALAGADILVAGSAVFAAGDIPASLAELTRLANTES